MTAEAMEVKRKEKEVRLTTRSDDERKTLSKKTSTST